MVKLHK